MFEGHPFQVSLKEDENENHDLGGPEIGCNPASSILCLELGWILPNRSLEKVHTEKGYQGHWAGTLQLTETGPWNGLRAQLQQL